MDKSKLPDMKPGKVVPTPWWKPKPKKRKPASGKPRGGVGGVLDAVNKRNKALEDAAK